ncbi:MAG TPA: hypothetical protein VG318_12330 [Actinomycetota bacterium]|nr:hypothetical protein [Actinomycetota bacterium]
MESIDRFYADERRRGSEEIRFGSQWRTPAWPSFEFAVFWVADTGELCALRSPIRDVASDGPVTRFVLGVPPHTNPQPLGDHEVTVEVLASLTAAEVDERLSGWESHHRDPDGFDWLRRALVPSAPS